MRGSTPPPGGETTGWVEVRVDVPAGWSELVSDALARAGCGAVLHVAASDPAPPPTGCERLRACLPAERDGAGARAALGRTLGELALRTGSDELRGLEASFRPLPPEEAAVAWRETWRPFRVGRVCVVPPWDGRTLRPSDLRLVLEPGGVFGTGRHGSTRACLRLLQRQLRPGDRVVDAGTGTGILAVASALLGASAAVGFDVDPSSAPAARALAQASGVAGACTFATAGLEFLDGERGSCDGLLANLYADLLQAELVRIVAALRPGAWFVLGGIARDRLGDTLRCVRAGPLVVESEHTGRWCALAAAETAPEKPRSAPALPVGAVTGYPGRLRGTRPPLGPSPPVSRTFPGPASPNPDRPLPPDPSPRASLANAMRLHSLRRGALAALLVCLPLALRGQAADPPFNSSLVSSIAPGSPDYADVWGSGDFAYVGRFFQNAIDVVDLTTPSSPSVEANYTVPAPNTGASAQDLKVATIGGAELLFIGLEFNDPHGVQVVDVRTPSSPTLLTNIDTEPGSFEEIHNVFIDGDFLYMDNSADNTISILDLSAYDPDSPPATIDAWTWRLNTVGNVFVHDITVQHDRLYASAWGSLEIYDTTDVATQAPNHIGSYLGLNTHAAWATDDGQYVVTSEEREGGGLRLFEIVDQGGSLLLIPRDSYVVPRSRAYSIHNPLIIGDRIYSSWYQAGGFVLEIDRTSNTMEVVASYDTSNTAASGFTGNWGMYPYLGEEKVLLSDIETGLHVVDFSALEFDFTSARPATVTPNQAKTIEVAIEELGTSVLDSATLDLHASVDGGPTITVPMTVSGGGYSAALPGASCGSKIEYWITADDTSARSFADPATAPAVKHVTYATYGLNQVFLDTFETNLGWSVVDHASLTSGTWTRGNPVGTAAQPERGDPVGTGQNCYFTGQGTVGGSVGAADLDGGPTTLTSPVMDFSAGDGLISYSKWLFNDDVDADFLTVEISNGGAWVNVETLTEKAGGWLKETFRVSDHVTPNATVQVRFHASDSPNNSVTEAGVDEVRGEVFDCTPPAQNLWRRGAVKRP